MDLTKDGNNKYTFMQVLQSLKVEISNQARKAMLLGQTNNTHGRKESGYSQCDFPVTDYRYWLH